MKNQLQIIPDQYLPYYRKLQPITISKHVKKLRDKAKDTPYDFGFAIKASSVYSSMIEGNPLDLDTYMRFSHSGMHKGLKPYYEIEDLRKAYNFAREYDPYHLDHLLAAHMIAMKTMLKGTEHRGVIRKKGVRIYADGVMIYTGAVPSIVVSEMEKLFHDIKILCKSKLSMNEVFYYASMIHLVLAHIHPFADGNGRMSRLMEKWFLAHHIGTDAWLIQSERLYKTRQRSYYKNMDLGPKYSELNYDLCMPFLKMLPMALRLKF